MVTIIVVFVVIGLTLGELQLVLRPAVNKRRGHHPFGPASRAIHKGVGHRYFQG
jgi:hypothetical protein